jgi:uncharacterized membrane protein YgdD (TMEM256/DUF423 family)
LSKSVKRDPLILAAALSAACAIAAGAFGAHAAKPPTTDWLKTGALYQLVHAVAAVALVGIARRQAWTMLTGATVFAATLYAMALGAPRILGAVTPIGGVMMIAAWLWLAFARR